MPPQRSRHLLAFLRQLGLDPTAAGGPGDSAAALAPIDEALSHSSAGLAHNHERLEFLGDAVLRLAATEFLQRHHPELSVGRSSALRAQLVSDRWLAAVAEGCGLAAVIRLGPMALGDRAGRTTLLAECCEALVGGLYEAWGSPKEGLEVVERWLGPHWQATIGDLMADPHRHNWKSALQEWSQGQGLGLPIYQCLERSRVHGDPNRFHCSVSLSTESEGPWLVGEGWGGSRREAEQQAARMALEHQPPGASSTAGIGAIHSPVAGVFRRAGNP
jgi:ribonuclease-3